MLKYIGKISRKDDPGQAGPGRAGPGTVPGKLMRMVPTGTVPTNTGSENLEQANLLEIINSPYTTSQPEDFFACEAHK